MEIDIEKYKKDCPTFETHANWIPRKILTEIYKHIEYMNNKIYIKNIVIGIDIYTYLSELGGFYYPSNKNNSPVGIISGLNVYLSNFIKSNEFFLFNDLDYLDKIEYEDKLKLRKKKLERILSE